MSWDIFGWNHDVALDGWRGRITVADLSAIRGLTDRTDLDFKRVSNPGHQIGISLVLLYFLASRFAFASVGGRND